MSMNLENYCASVFVLEGKEANLRCPQFHQGLSSVSLSNLSQLLASECRKLPSALPLYSVPRQPWRPPFSLRMAVLEKI